MTVFVVLLILCMLGAIGVFAARASQLGVTTSGRYRQMVQTHYLAMGGMQGAIAEFGRDPNGYLVQMRNTPSPPTIDTVTGKYPCDDIPYITAVPTFKPASTVCLRLGYGAVEAAAQRTLPPGFELFVKKGTSSGVSVPGSFGMADIAGNFSVEFTDERPADVPPAGMPITGPGGTKLKYKSVTARAIGEVLPTNGAGAVRATTADDYKYTTSVETIRAEVLVGPVP